MLARGDVVICNFDEDSIGHEQRKTRPSVVVSPTLYNRKFKMILCCPLTSTPSRNPFEVSLPHRGTVLINQLRAFDKQANQLRVIDRLSEIELQEVMNVLQTFFA